MIQRKCKIITHLFPTSNLLPPSLPTSPAGQPNRMTITHRTTCNPLKVVPYSCIKYARPFWTPLRLKNPSVLRIPSRTCLPAYVLAPGIPSSPLPPASICTPFSFALLFPLNLQMKSPSIRFLIGAFRLPEARCHPHVHCGGRGLIFRHPPRR